MGHARENPMSHYKNDVNRFIDQREQAERDMKHAENWSFYQVWCLFRRCYPNHQVVELEGDCGGKRRRDKH